jgi:beta-lactam-binding protein with PASTA domain
MRRAARLALLAAAAGVAPGLSPALRAQRAMVPGTRQVLPSVTGLTLDSALNALAWTRVHIVQIESRTMQALPTTVIAQRPAAGSPLISTRAETLYWAGHPAKVITGIPAHYVGGVAMPPAATTQTAPPPATAPTDSAPTTTTHVSISKAAAVLGTVVRDYTRVPDLRGRTPQEVVKMLEALRLAVGNQTRDYSDDVPSGRVFRQHPEASRSPVATATRVDVWYSIGPHPAAMTIPVPSVVGLALANARDSLGRAKLRLGHVDTTFLRGASGVVKDQTPQPASRAHAEDAVDLVLAFPLRTVTVPRIIGLTRAAARANLRRVGLDLGQVKLVSLPDRDTVVIDQAPAAERQVDPGTLVAIVENRPAVRRQVPIPDLRGMTRAQADQRLRQNGLSLGVVSLANEFPSPVVVAQDPSAPGMAYASSAVNVTMQGTAPPPSRPDSSPGTRQSRTRPDATKPQRYVHVPPVVGLTVHGARQTLTDSGLTHIVLDGDSISATSVVVFQAPQAGDLVLVDGTVTLLTGVNVNRVPTLVGLSEGDAHDEAVRHDLLMNVQARRRALRWSEAVVEQSPRPRAPVRADMTVDVDLEIPFVPLMPTTIVFMAGALAEGVRRKVGWPHRLGYDPEADAPGAPGLEPDRPSLIRTSIWLEYDAGAGPWELEPRNRSLIKQPEGRDV